MALYREKDSLHGRMTKQPPSVPAEEKHAHTQYFREFRVRQ